MTAPARCDQCGNHSMLPRNVAGAQVQACDLCGYVEGPPDIAELIDLQREAAAQGRSMHSYPLATFLAGMAGVKVLKDSGGNADGAVRPFVTFTLTDHRTTQLENLGQALRIMRDELECPWVVEFTFDFELAFELRTRHAVPNDGPELIEAAQRDLGRIWRRLQQYSGLGWWKR